MNYYARSGATHIDGTPIFATSADRAAEEEVARRLVAAWGCELHRFGALAPVDWYALRDGRMAGVVEVKSRGHRKADYPTVFLNVRKWMWLTRYSMGLGVRALFVVRFADALCWVPLDEVDARRHRIGGCARQVKARSDVEPVIEVPVELMREIAT
jgi:hypothetical protein